jgi:hypothetical protein
MTMNQWSLMAAALASVVAAGSVQAVVLISLDAATVAAGGTPVTALAAGHRNSGGWIQNPPTATTNLCINERGAATTTPGGDVTCIVPGQTYLLAGSADRPVSVVSSDSAHAFSGYGWN